MRYFVSAMYFFIIDQFWRYLLYMEYEFQNIQFLFRFGPGRFCLSKFVERKVLLFATICFIIQDTEYALQKAVFELNQIREQYNMIQNSHCRNEGNGIPRLRTSKK